MYNILLFRALHRAGSDGFLTSKNYILSTTKVDIATRDQILYKVLLLYKLCNINNGKHEIWYSSYMIHGTVHTYMRNSSLG